MNDSDTEYRRVFDAWTSGEHAKALEMCRELLRKFPDYTIGRLLEGIILYELGRYDTAEQRINEAIQGLGPEELPHGYIHLGHLHRKRGNYDEAEKWYRRAAELNPDNAGRHIILGEVLASKGDFQNAEASYRTAIRCSHGPIDEGWLNLGLILRAQERYPEALICFEKALDLSPDYSAAALGKADVVKAIAFLEALRID